MRFVTWQELLITVAVFSIFENAIHFYENNISVQKKKKKKDLKISLIYFMQDIIFIINIFST